MSSFKKILKKVDHRLGVELINIKHECDNIQYHSSRLEVNNNRLREGDDL